MGSTRCLRSLRGRNKGKTYKRVDRPHFVVDFQHSTLRFPRHKLIDIFIDLLPAKPIRRVVKSSMTTPENDQANMGHGHLRALLQSGERNSSKMNQRAKQQVSIKRHLSSNNNVCGETIPKSDIQQHIASQRERSLSTSSTSSTSSLSEENEEPLSLLSREPSPFLVATIIESHSVEVQSVLLCAPTRSSSTCSSLANSRHGSILRQRSDVTPSSSSRRRIRFDTQKTEFHASGRTMTAQEWEQCWFSPQDLKSFKVNQADIVKRLFGKPTADSTNTDKGNQASSESSSSSSLSSRRSWLSCKSGKLGSLLSSKRSSTSGIKPKFPHRQPSKKSHLIRQEEEETDWRESMDIIYQECRKVRRGQMVGKVDRELFQKLYQEHEELVGLEVYILFALRGTVSSQVRNILKVARAGRNADATQELKREGEDRSSTRKSNDEELRRHCLRFTLPAKYFVHEMAMAQSSALQGCSF